jgi:3-methyladenine DNA glycosylase Tag
VPDIIIPPRIKPQDDQGYFEILTKAVFQAGFSWQIVERKWFGFKEIFHDFDPSIIAKWNEEDILNALESPQIIRNEKKIRATIENAKVFQKIINNYESFDLYLGSIASKPYLEISKILTKKFQWLGRTGAYFFLYCVEEDVPRWEDR